MKRLFYQLIWMASFHRRPVIRTISYAFPQGSPLIYKVLGVPRGLHDPGELDLYARGKCKCSIIYFALPNNAELRPSSGHQFQTRRDWRSLDVPQRLSSFL